MFVLAIYKGYLLIHSSFGWIKGTRDGGLLQLLLGKVKLEYSAMMQWPVLTQLEALVLY